MKKNNCPLESEEQIKVFSWINSNKKKYPELALCHSSLNGVKLSPGSAVKAKRQGMVAGVPDIFLPVDTADYNGLFIELKRKIGGKVSTEQKAFIEALQNQCFKVVICYGANDAIQTIKDYLGIKD